jgi:hypothetical protein
MASGSPGRAIRDLTRLPADTIAPLRTTVVAAVLVLLPAAGSEARTIAEQVEICEESAAVQGNEAPSSTPASSASWASATSSARRWWGTGRQGRAAANSPIVQAAVSVTRALGFPVTLDEGSTDANYPQSLGIPAITIDGGGRDTGAHALNEAFDTTDSWKGTQRALLLAVAPAQP